jgi:hypothetical protein
MVLAAMIRFILMEMDRNFNLFLYDKNPALKKPPLPEGKGGFYIQGTGNSHLPGQQKCCSKFAERLNARLHDLQNRGIV